MEAFDRMFGFQSIQYPAIKRSLLFPVDMCLHFYRPISALFVMFEFGGGLMRKVQNGHLQSLTSNEETCISETFFNE